MARARAGLLGRRRGALARRLRYPLEATALVLVYRLFGALSIDRASDLGGWIARTLGPRLALSRRARRNLERAFPDKPPEEVARILAGMWDNLGRVLAEYPHLSEIRLYDGDGRVEVVGAETVDLLREDGKPGIFFSAHLGNWEISSMGATQRGVPLTRVYRAPNNPLADRLIRHARRMIEGELLPKGARGTRQALAAMGRGGHLAMLVDQKMNDGIPVPFFGRPAMTAPALALLARRFDCPVVPARVERLGGARFRLTFYPPLDLPRSGDAEADAAAAMAKVNAVIEGWIRERPEQWLWLHRRWPD